MSPIVYTNRTSGRHVIADEAREDLDRLARWERIELPADADLSIYATEVTEVTGDDPLTPAIVEGHGVVVGADGIQGLPGTPDGGEPGTSTGFTDPDTGFADSTVAKPDDDDEQEAAAAAATTEPKRPVEITVTADSSVAEIDAFAEKHDIAIDKRLSKPNKLAAIHAALTTTP